MQHVDRDALAGHLRAEPFGEVRDEGVPEPFGKAVVWWRDAGPDPGNTDHPALSGAPEMRQGGPGAADCPETFDHYSVHDLVVAEIVKPFRMVVHVRRSIVHQDIQSAERLHGLLDDSNAVKGVE